MINKPLILAIKGDARQQAAVRALKGCFDTTLTQFPLSGAESADVLFLPMLTGSGSFEELSSHLKSGALILGGRMPDELKQSFSSMGFEPVDYYDSETLRLKNALPTAEGTLMLAMQNTPYVIGGSSVLVTGFGACGRQIARLFSAVGATVCVAARSPSARAEAEAQGFRSATLENLSGIISAADIIINTVPAKIIGRQELSSAKENALFIEIASAPFGIDEKCASELGINYVKAPALPARYAPQTSGEYIAQTVKELIEQRREGSP